MASKLSKTCKKPYEVIREYLLQHGYTLSEPIQWDDTKKVTSAQVAGLAKLSSKTGVITPEVIEYFENRYHALTSKGVSQEERVKYDLTKHINILKNREGNPVSFPTLRNYYTAFEYIKKYEATLTAVEVIVVDSDVDVKDSRFSSNINLTDMEESDLVASLKKQLEEAENEIKRIKVEAKNEIRKVNLKLSRSDNALDFMLRLTATISPDICNAILHVSNLGYKEGSGPLALDARAVTREEFRGSPTLRKVAIEGEENLFHKLTVPMQEDVVRLITNEIEEEAD